MWTLVILVYGCCSGGASAPAITAVPSFQSAEACYKAGRIVEKQLGTKHYVHWSCVKDR